MKLWCFGDSNTWGYTPGTGVRYPMDVRWTGVMQNALGADYHVIEDGQNARTTVYEDMWRKTSCVAREYAPFADEDREDVWYWTIRCCPL